MSPITSDAVALMDMLPEHDQKFAFEFIKKLVLAWDPDHTKLTPAERESLERAKLTESIAADQIDWDDLDSV